MFSEPYIESLIFGRDLDSIEYLIDNGFDFNGANGRYIRAAAESGHLKVVKYLAKNGVDFTNCFEYINLPASSYIIQNGEKRRPEKIHAYEYQHLKTIKYLVNIGAKYNIAENSALYDAADNNHYTIVKYLFSIGTIPNRIPFCDLPMMKLFVNNGADITNDDGDLYMEVCISYDLEMIKYLVSIGVVFDTSENWCFDTVIYDGDPIVIKYLVSLGYWSDELNPYNYISVLNERHLVKIADQTIQKIIRNKQRNYDWTNDIVFVFIKDRN